MRALRPLRRSAYRRLATALALSVLAEGLWTLAVVWQVVELGGGPVELSLVSGALALGVIVTALLGGVLADRVPQKRILVGVMAMLAVSIGLVAGLSALGALSVPLLVVVAAVIGLSMGLFFPAYSALVPAMVDADELLAVNGFEGVVRPVLLQGAGPALAGVLVAWGPMCSPTPSTPRTRSRRPDAVTGSVSLAQRAIRAGNHRCGGQSAAREVVDGFRYVRRRVDAAGCS